MLLFTVYVCVCVCASGMEWHGCVGRWIRIWIVDVDVDVDVIVCVAACVHT